MASAGGHWLKINYGNLSGTRVFVATGATHKQIRQAIADKAGASMYSKSVHDAADMVTGQKTATDQISFAGQAGNTSGAKAAIAQRSPSIDNPQSIKTPADASVALHKAEKAASETTPSWAKKYDKGGTDFNKAGQTKAEKAAAAGEYGDIQSQALHSNQVGYASPTTGLLAKKITDYNTPYYIYRSKGKDQASLFRSTTNKPIDVVASNKQMREYLKTGKNPLMAKVPKKPGTWTAAAGVSTGVVKGSMSTQYTKGSFVMRKTGDHFTIWKSGVQVGKFLEQHLSDAMWWLTNQKG